MPSSPISLRLGVLSSHSGTNMQAIIDANKSGRLAAHVNVAISNNSTSMTLVRARREGIPGYHLSSKTHPDPGNLDRAILTTLIDHEVNLVVMAGYTKLLGPVTIDNFRGRALNIHPSLLPKFGGKGLYGPAVQRAVLAAGESLTGVTIHLADELLDHGRIIAQTKVPVLKNDSEVSLGKRVLAQEHELYVKTLLQIEYGNIELSGW